LANTTQATKANVWMIDFAKCRRLPPQLQTINSHYETHLQGDHDDGYLIGLTNLLSIFDEIMHELNDNEKTRHM
jgi:1D-myo-inositol-triphosphate 3-kinase